ncbi:MAG: porin [Candidatus Eisenbacteria bacterium]|uniref:Porin n=1 Tax=Eiseniibacteriota bacterium TaxID=2212470 RepID=A0A933SG01_UNCEI|nr:porin [Candidatus Eisenbacteria bacterium]
MWPRTALIACFAAGGLLAVSAPVALGAADSTTAAPVAAASAPAIAPPKLGGYLQVRAIAQAHAGLSQSLNRARFSIDGKLPERFSYRLLAELEASTGAKSAATPSLRETYVRWTSAPVMLTAGQFKVPFSREVLISLTQLELADLATVLDSLAPKYDVGVMLEHAHGAEFTFQLGVFNGDGANATVNRDSTVMWAARTVFRPIPPLALGLSGTRDGDDSLRWCADAQVQHRGATLRGEYAKRVVRGRATDANEFGWYLLESYRPTPDVMLVARQERYERPVFGAARRVRGLAFAASYDVAPSHVKLLAEWSRREAGVRLTRTDAFLAQVQVVY